MKYISFKTLLACVVGIAAILGWQEIVAPPKAEDSAASTPVMDSAAPAPQETARPVQAPSSVGPQNFTPDGAPATAEPVPPSVEPPPEQELRFGRIPPHIREIYASYSLDVLEAMGEDGDIAALDTLARRYIDANEMEQMQRILIKSAAFGSTEAAVVMGSYLHFSVEGLADSDPAIHGQKLLEALSWYEFAARLGEPGVEKLQDALLEAYPHRAPDLVPGAMARADALYDELSAERIKRGLPQYNE